MSVNCPSPELLKSTVLQELEHRRSQHPGVDCEVVLRHGGFVGSAIDCHEQLPRAMVYAREHISRVERGSGSVHNGMVVLADTMSSSKGRFSRQWHAPAGGVWGCLVHASTLLRSSAALVPLALGLACCEAAHTAGADSATLRWVNDVLFGERKTAGFLIEGFTGPRFGEEYHLLGFGINVNNTSFPPELAGLATSLSLQLGHELDISEFTALFLAKLSWNLGLLYYEEALQLAGDRMSGVDGTHLLLENWRKCSDTVGQRVVFGFDVITAPQYEASVTRLEPDGGIRMRFDDGSEKVEYSGEIRYR